MRPKSLSSSVYQYFYELAAGIVGSLKLEVPGRLLSRRIGRLEATPWFWPIIDARVTRYVITACDQRVSVEFTERLDL